MDLEAHVPDSCANVSKYAKPTQDGLVQLDLPKTADNFLSGFEPIMTTMT